MRAGTGVHTHIQTHVRIDAQVILAISVDSGAYMYILWNAYMHCTHAQCDTHTHTFLSHSHRHYRRNMTAIFHGSTKIDKASQQEEREREEKRVDTVGREMDRHSGERKSERAQGGEREGVCVSYGSLWADLSGWAPCTEAIAPAPRRSLGLQAGRQMGCLIPSHKERWWQTGSLLVSPAA